MEDLLLQVFIFAITGFALGANAKDFEIATKDAEKNCVVSKALSVPISSEAHFVA